MWESLLSFLFLEKEMKSLSVFLYPAGCGGVGGWVARSVLYPGTDAYNHGTPGGAFLVRSGGKGRSRGLGILREPQKRNGALPLPSLPPQEALPGATQAQTLLIGVPWKYGAADAP